MSRRHDTSGPFDPVRQRPPRRAIDSYAVMRPDDISYSLQPRRDESSSRRVCLWVRGVYTCCGRAHRSVHIDRFDTLLFDVSHTVGGRRLYMYVFDIF